MIEARLVLLEGPVGAGKSTTGRLLAERLRERGVLTRDWFGFDPEHPIQTACEKTARRFFGGEVDVALPALDPADPLVFTAPQWARLAATLAAGEEVLVVEGKYFQQCLEYPRLLGASVDDLHAMQDAIVRAMTPARPHLVAFAPTDRAAHRARVVAERPATWPGALGGMFARHPWGRSRGLDGEAAFHAFYDEWAPLETTLVERHDGPTLTLVDAHLDREAAWRSIDAFLGVDRG